MANELLSVTDLRTEFRVEEGTVRAVDGVSFSLRERETLAIVGESGSGKSVTALSILGLIQRPGRITGGSITYDGRDLLRAGERQMRAIRGNQISMIFQEPMTSLNPVFTVGDQIAEVLRIHQGLRGAKADAAVVESLRLVNIPNPERFARNHPYQLSGGMRQRVMIAMALACQPRILIADEPTTALDVTIQNQIIALMADLQHRVNAAIILITHDMGVVAQLADTVMIMYAGKAMEYGDARSVFHDPLHPYTVGLLDSIPDRGETRRRLKIIPGVVPSPFALPTGCAFSTRCPDVMDVCREKEPAYLDRGGGRRVRCWKYAREAGA